VGGKGDMPPKTPEVALCSVELSNQHSEWPSKCTTIRIDHKIKKKFWEWYCPFPRPLLQCGGDTST